MNIPIEVLYRILLYVPTTCIEKMSLCSKSLYKCCMYEVKKRSQIVPSILEYVDNVEEFKSLLRESDCALTGSIVLRSLMSDTFHIRNMDITCTCMCYITPIINNNGIIDDQPTHDDWRGYIERLCMLACNGSIDTEADITTFHRRCRITRYMREHLGYKVKAMQYVTSIGAKIQATSIEFDSHGRYKYAAKSLVDVMIPKCFIVSLQKGSKEILIHHSNVEAESLRHLIMSMMVSTHNCCYWPSDCDNINACYHLASGEVRARVSIVLNSWINQFISNEWINKTLDRGITLLLILKHGGIPDLGMRVNRITNNNVPIIHYENESKETIAEAVCSLIRKRYNQGEGLFVISGRGIAKYTSQALSLNMIDKRLKKVKCSLECGQEQDVREMIENRGEIYMCIDKGYDPEIDRGDFPYRF